jgi:hypothetical protein
VNLTRQEIKDALRQAIIPPQPPLIERVYKALELVGEGLSRSDLELVFPDSHPASIKQALRRLVSRQKIQCHTEKRSDVMGRLQSIPVYNSVE